MNVDLPVAMYERVKALADDPPAVPVTEWIRRVLAHHAGFPLPSLSERRAARVRLTGEPKAKTGVKPRG